MKSLEVTRLSITVNEARKILGAKYKDRSDKEIRDLIKELEDRKLEIDDELSPSKCEPVIEGGVKYLRNPSVVWQNGDTNLKTNYQKWIFPEGIEYHPETGLQTRQKCLTYSMIESFQSGDSAMVEVRGIT